MSAAPPVVPTFAGRPAAGAAPAAPRGTAVPYVDYFAPPESLADVDDEGVYSLFLDDDHLYSHF